MINRRAVLSARTRSQRRLSPRFSTRISPDEADEHMPETRYSEPTFHETCFTERRASCGRVGPAVVPTVEQNAQAILEKALPE